MNLIFLLIKSVFIILIGIIYLPLNMLLMKLGEFTQSFKTKDPMVYWLLHFIFVPVWLVTTILSKPYEALVESAH